MTSTQTGRSALAVAAELDAAGRHDDAVNELAVAARGGDVAALAELARRLLVGDRAPHMPDEALKFLLEALNKGSAEAALRLAVLAALGTHVEQSYSGALELLGFAAERGLPAARAQVLLLAGEPLSAEAITRPRDWRVAARAVDWRSWVTPPQSVVVHEEPLVRSFPSFVSADVCIWLIERARPLLTRALVYNPHTHENEVASTRTNSVAGFGLAECDMVHAMLQGRMSACCGVPLVCMEAPAVLHYAPGQEIAEHFDFVDPEIPNYAEEIAVRGERIITFLVYLNDDYASGETEFPRLGVRHKGRMGEGLYFTNALGDGSPDTRMIHAGRPPSGSEKWIVSQFIRNRAVLPQSRSV
jgi:prolyl 4-hydroxylase